MTETDTTRQLDEEDEDDLSTFSEYELDQLHSPWEPPPGDRLPTRREWRALSRLDRFRWRARFGKDWAFGAPRGPRTAADWDALPDNQRTPEVFEGLTHAAKVELQDRGLDPTTLEAPAPASEGDENVDEPDLIDDTNAILIEPDAEEHDDAVKNYAAANQGWLDALDAGKFDGLPLDRKRIEELRLESTPELEGTAQYAEAVQRLAAIRAIAKNRMEAEAPFIPIRRTTRNYGDYVVTVEADSLGREREVSRMTAEEVSAALEAEEQEGTETFGPNPLRSAIEGWSQWSPSRRRSFLEQHPEDFSRFTEALSLEEERSR